VEDDEAGDASSHSVATINKSYAKNHFSFHLVFYTSITQCNTVYIHKARPKNMFPLVRQICSLCLKTAVN
jgi:hypothetical protein